MANKLIIPLLLLAILFAGCVDGYGALPSNTEVNEQIDAGQVSNDDAEHLARNGEDATLPIDEDIRELVEFFDYDPYPLKSLNMEIPFDPIPVKSEEEFMRLFTDARRDNRLDQFFMRLGLPVDDEAREYMLHSGYGLQSVGEVQHEGKTYAITLCPFEQGVTLFSLVFLDDGVECLLIDLIYDFTFSEMAEFEHNNLKGMIGYSWAHGTGLEMYMNGLYNFFTREIELCFIANGTYSYLDHMSDIESIVNGYEGRDGNSYLYVKKEFVLYEFLPDGSRSNPLYAYVELSLYDLQKDSGLNLIGTKTLESIGSIPSVMDSVLLDELL